MVPRGSALWPGVLGWGRATGRHSFSFYFSVSCVYGPKDTANGLIGGDEPRIPQHSQPFQVQLHRDLGDLSGVLRSAAWGRPGPPCCLPWAPCPQGT